MGQPSSKSMTVEDQARGSLTPVGIHEDSSSDVKDSAERGVMALKGIAIIEGIADMLLSFVVQVIIVVCECSTPTFLLPLFFFQFFPEIDRKEGGGTP